MHLGKLTALLWFSKIPSRKIGPFAKHKSWWQTEIFRCKKIQFLYLHKYFYGGATTFTAHLLHSLQAERIARIGKRSETNLRQFGYGLHYQNVSINDVLDSTERPFFITIFKENYLPVIIRLNDEDSDKNILVIHDHRDISEKV